jgi:hypothetical protein
MPRAKLSNQFGSIQRSIDGKSLGDDKESAGKCRNSKLLAGALVRLVYAVGSYRMHIATYH